MSDIDLFPEDAIPEQWHVPPMDETERLKLRERFGLLPEFAERQRKNAIVIGQEILSRLHRTDTEADL